MRPLVVMAACSYHLSDAERMTEVVKWIVTIILLNCYLWEDGERRLCDCIAQMCRCVM